jgi:GT2 family glycosyltransferase
VSKAKPRVTVIVLNYNGSVYVRRCLSSIFRNNYLNYEVFFIDNNSADGSAEMALRLFGSEPRFVLIRNKQNLGFSVGNNVGFKRTKAKYVIVLNNDTEVGENFIETLVNIAESDDKVGSVGCKIVQLDGRILYGPKFMNYGFIVRALDHRIYDKFVVNLANCGCATLFRKSVIDEIGGFDPNLWTDWEDHDFGFRMNIAGFKSVYTPLTTVLHLGGGNYFGLTDERETRIIRNKLFTYVKNYQARTLFVRFPIVLTIAFLGKIRYRKEIQFFRGIFRLFKMIKQIVRERKQVQRTRIVSDNQIFSSCRIPEQQSFWESLKVV